MYYNTWSNLHELDVYNKCFNNNSSDMTDQTFPTQFRRLAGYFDKQHGPFWQFAVRHNSRKLRREFFLSEWNYFLINQHYLSLMNIPGNLTTPINTDTLLITVSWLHRSNWTLKYFLHFRQRRNTEYKLTTLLFLIIVERLKRFILQSTFQKGYYITSASIILLYIFNVS